MPTYLAPGVYVEEVESGSKPIEGAGTSTAAFIGFTAKAPEDNPDDPEGKTPRFISNWTQFETHYGGFADDIQLPHAVYGWFNNGGGGAYIVRVPTAASGGAAAASAEGESGGGRKRRGSAGPTGAPSGGAEEHHVGAEAFVGSEADRTGIMGLAVADDVTMVIVPDLITATRDSSGTVDLTTYQAVQTAMITHCEKMGNRMAVLDSPPGMNPQQVKNWRSDTAKFDSKFAAFYYPWIKVSNPLAGPQAPTQPKTITIPPSGHIAGVWARSDSSRGVWKAPANEVVQGALDVEMQVTSEEQELLNPIGVNVTRSFGTRGIRIWGARTLTSDPSWRYINVRRLFNFLETSIQGGTNWVVFEPNDAALWARVRRTVNAFLLGMWRNGALFGATSGEAFFVKCDGENNPPESIDEGKLIIDVGVAPVKPAEFVVFRISQIAGGGEGGE